MINELFCKTVIPRDKSGDGETPGQIIVTAENNGTAVWDQSFELGLRLAKFFPWSRDQAIEYAVHDAESGRLQKEIAEFKRQSAEAHARIEHFGDYR